MASVTCGVCGSLSPAGLTECQFCDSQLLVSAPPPNLDPAEPGIRASDDPFVRQFSTNSRRIVLRSKFGLEIDVTVSEVITLGRNPASPISATATDNVSFNHALITMDSSGPYVTDQGSTNGTTVDGRRLEPSLPFSISTGSTIELAKNPAYRLTVEERTP